MAIFTAEQRKSISLSSLGGAIEFYDFIVFVFFAKTLGKLFFPTEDPIAELMSTFGVFAMGYFARPLGGMLFGHFGDRLGRKKTFIATIILMAVPTFLMGCLPTYASIGIWAPCLLVLLRILQGLSVGGEIPGAIVFASETAHAERRGLACGIVFFGINIGLLAGSFVSTGLTNLLSESSLLQWGWRVPFWVGGILGVIGFFLRKQTQETAYFKTTQNHQQVLRFPLSEIIRKYPRQVLCGVAITGMQAMLVSVLYLYMPTYLATTFHFPTAKLLTLNTVNIMLFAVYIFIVSYWSDKIGRKKIITSSVFCFLIFAYFLFSLFQHQSFGLVIITTIILGMLSGCVASCFAPMLAELFPTNVRYSGTALCYNIAFAFFGGLTPLVATTLIKVTENQLAPSFYLMAVAAIAFIALFFIRDSGQQPLKN